MQIGFHNITSIVVEETSSHHMEDGRTFFARTLIIDHDGITQRISLFAKTAESLSIIDEAALTAAYASGRADEAAERDKQNTNVHQAVPPSDAAAFSAADRRGPWPFGKTRAERIAEIDALDTPF